MKCYFWEASYATANFVWINIGYNLYDTESEKKDTTLIFGLRVILNG